MVDRSEVNCEIGMKFFVKVFGVFSKVHKVKPNTMFRQREMEEKGKVTGMY